MSRTDWQDTEGDGVYVCWRCLRTFPVGWEHDCAGTSRVTTIADHDPVNSPKHYTSHPSGVECIQITEHLSFCVGNAIKYLWRADLKNGTEDLEKAAWYVAREIERRKRATP